MDDSRSFTDLQHSTDLSAQDYELFPDCDSVAHPLIFQRTSEMQRQLSRGDHTMKAPWFPSAMSLSNPSMHLDQIGSPHGMDVQMYPVMSDISSPFSGDPSSPGAESGPSNSSSWWNMGCYMSPPSSCADSMLPPLDHWGSSSPAASTNLDASVAPSQIVQSYPIPIPIAELDLDLDARLGDEPIPVCNHNGLQHSTLGDTSCTLPYLGAEPAADQDSIPSPPRPVPATNRSGQKRGTRPKNGIEKRSGKKETLNGGAIRTRRTLSKIKTRKSSRPQRAFVCSFSHYGCTSSFASKNEWKRHVTSQHVQIGFYRCDVGQCNLNNMNKDAGMSSANDFNRKDLFTQHQRRMHAPWSKLSLATEEEKQQFDAGLEAVRHRCWREQRQAPPRSQCGFCGEEFAGHQSWNRRMEHVGRHFEKGDASPEGEKEDIALRDWAIKEGIVRRVEGQWKLASHCEK